jgi:hypothetical protein
MRAIRGALLVLVAASAGALADPPAPGRIERAPEFQARVGKAIERGVEWIREAQQADGSFPAYADYPGATTAFAYHAMRACGVPKDDVAAANAWNALRRGYKKADLKTYTAVLYLMAIASHGEPVAKPVDERDVRLSVEDARWATEIACCLAGGQDEDGRWTYQVDTTAKTVGSGTVAPRAPGLYDHSNTQYALLGLKCAARCRVAVDPSVWKRSLLYFLAEQEADGPESARGAGWAGPRTKPRVGPDPVDHARGWGYMGHADKTTWRLAIPSMTAGGVSSIVICRSELMGTHEMTQKLDADSERAAWDGLAWLGAKWDPSPPAGKRSAPLPDPYEFYGVERAGVLAGVERMGDVDWYARGAARLLDGQERDGKWRAGSTPGAAAQGVSVDPAHHLVDTCFALLFLAKGTTPVRRGAVTDVGGDVDINFAAAAKVSGKDLDDVLDLVLARRRRATDDAVVARLFDGATSIGPKIVEPLLVRMESPDADKRAAAHELLARATGLDFGWRADATPESRGDAVVKWQTWWIAAKDKLVYDPAAKRLVAR